MVPIITLIFVIAISMLVTKTATIALMHTGLSRDRARFQARSAFSGAGFTTTESELVVKHPVRRKIIMLLILLGNAGVVTAISSLILGFVGSPSSGNSARNFGFLALGVSLLYLAARSERLDRFLNKLINRLLLRVTEFRPQSFSKLMTVMEDFEVSEVQAKENAWLRDRKLSDLKLPDEGLLVLGILREDDTYIGVPRGKYVIEEEDRLILYGKADRIANLSKRGDELTGKAEHMETVEEHQEELGAQDQIVAATEDPES